MTLPVVVGLFRNFNLVYPKVQSLLNFGIDFFYV